MDLPTLEEWRSTKLSSDPEVAALQERYMVVMGDRVLYGPQPRQAHAHSKTEPYILYGGAVAGGKSHWERWHLILSAAAIDNFRGLLLRRTYKELETSQLLAITLEVPRELARWSTADKQLKFENGSIIQFGHCNTDADFAQWLSSEWDMICLDEASTFTPWQLTMLRSRLRTSKPGVRPQYALGSNPGGPGHLWLKSRFIDRSVSAEDEPGYDASMYAFVPAKVDDNSYINPEYAAFLDTLPEDERRAYRDGDWDVFAGQFFRQLRREVHGFNFPEDMPESWRRWPKWRSYDWGYSAPASMGWWTVDPDGNAYRYRELYQRGMEVEDFMALALDLSMQDSEDGTMPDYEYTVADPACWDSAHGPSKAERAAKCGVEMVPAERKAQTHMGVRVEGWSLMRRYIDPASSPLLRVAYQCRDWWRTVPQLVHDDKRVEDVDSDGEDHAADETRYFLTSRPTPAFVARESTERGNPFPAGSPSWHAHEKLMRDLKTRQRVTVGTAGEGPQMPVDPLFGELW